jgi:hypothetical protein
MKAINLKVFSFTPALLFTASLFISVPLQADYQKQSKSPPAGLSANKVPMFVSIGFDDNGDAEGMNWIVDFLRSRTNKDGSPARVTFFNTTKDVNKPAVRKAWKEAYKDGHEVGNHTVSHNIDSRGNDINGRGLNFASWDDEVSSAHWALDTLVAEAVSEMGNMPANPNPKVIGFRAPRLEINNNLFTVLKSENYVYDTSYEDGKSDDGKDFPWPFTMDHGAANTNLWAHPGIWQLGVMNVVRPNGSQLTGFDYNMWSKDLTHRLSETESVKTLLNTLKLRMQGNRSPFLLGGHSAFYSSTYSGSMSIDYEARRRVMKAFIIEALKIPEVRIVPYNNVVKWMRSPVALSGSSSGGSNTGGGNSSGGGNTSSINFDAIAWEINNFQELIDNSYNAGHFKSGQSYGLAAISKNLLNAANSVWGENPQAAMISLYTAEWYVSNTMRDTRVRSIALEKINSYLRKIGY